jgi:hypothetical protein
MAVVDQRHGQQQSCRQRERGRECRDFAGIDLDAACTAALSSDGNGAVKKNKKNQNDAK